VAVPRNGPGRPAPRRPDSWPSRPTFWSTTVERAPGAALEHPTNLTRATAVRAADAVGVHRALASRVQSALMKRPTSAFIGRNVRKTYAKSGKPWTSLESPRPTTIAATRRNSSCKGARLKIVVSPVRVRVSPSENCLLSGRCAARPSASLLARKCRIARYAIAGRAAVCANAASAVHDPSTLRVRLPADLRGRERAIGRRVQPAPLLELLARRGRSRHRTRACRVLRHRRPWERTLQASLNRALTLLSGGALSAARPSGRAAPTPRHWTASRLAEPASSSRLLPRLWRRGAQAPRLKAAVSDLRRSDTRGAGAGMAVAFRRSGLDEFATGPHRA
jgi:hypothetical protein